MLSSILVVIAVSMTQLSDTLQNASIIAEKGYTVSRTDTVAIRSEIGLAEFLSSIPTLGINDNGGSAGLKSINFRGMGSAFTNIYVDGIKLNNLQSGQADISFLALDQFSSAKIDYAQNSLNFSSIKPYFANGPFNAEAKLSYGSFGTAESGLKLDYRLNKELTLRASASYLISKGDFGYGEGLTRDNNDITRYNAGIDLWGKLRKGDWQAKAYASSTDRGTAGAIGWPSSDRQKDLNLFAQGSMKKDINKGYRLILSAKAAADRVDFISSWGNSSYFQKELQLNSSQIISINKYLSSSISANLQWDALDSDVYGAERTSIDFTGAAVYKYGRFNAQMEMEYQVHFDRNNEIRDILSPALQIRYALCDWINLSALSRRAFRMPSFNELYYTGYGNPELKPENAWLSDIGLQADRQLGNNWKLAYKLNFFYNELKDKIVSAPTEENPNIWLPYNIASASNKGIDSSISSTYNSEDLRLKFTAAYSFQDSMIPYVNRHNLNLNANLNTKGWDMLLSWILRAGRRDSSGEMPDWNSLDLKISRSFVFGRNDIMLYLSGNNLLDERYESVRDYPMPGRSIRIGIIYKLK